MGDIVTKDAALTLAWVAQILFNIVILGAVVAGFVQLRKKRSEDAKLSKGLQLLQSKISVLEDLSDKVEQQVSQSLALIESKQIEVGKKLSAADEKLLTIHQSMQKSIEVAKIFEDKIPHSEIIDRKKTIDYVKAAMMAHQGASVEQIAKAVDLPRGEIEMLAKVNRQELSFAQDQLPEWIKSEVGLGVPSRAQVQSTPTETSVPNDNSLYFAPAIIHSDDDQDWQVTGPDFQLPELQPTLSADENLKRLGEKFRQAAMSFEKMNAQTPARAFAAESEAPQLREIRYAEVEDESFERRDFIPATKATTAPNKVNSKMLYPPVDDSLQPSVFHKVSRPANSEPVRVRKVEFPKVG